MIFVRIRDLYTRQLTIEKRPHAGIVSQIGLIRENVPESLSKNLRVSLYTRITDSIKNEIDITLWIMIGICLLLPTIGFGKWQYNPVFPDISAWQSG